MNPYVLLAGPIASSQKLISLSCCVWYAGKLGGFVADVSPEMKVDRLKEFIQIKMKMSTENFPTHRINLWKVSMTMGALKERIEEPGFLPEEEALVFYDEMKDLFPEPTKGVVHIVAKFPFLGVYPVDYTILAPHSFLPVGLERTSREQESLKLLSSFCRS